MKDEKKSEKYHYGFGSEPVLPKAETFSDLFEDGQGNEEWRGEGAISTISDYVHARPVPLEHENPNPKRPHFQSWKRKPKANVIDAVKKFMLCINHDTIHFEIIIDDEDGTASVFASYGQIIGSRYLAQIKADSIPS